MFSLFKPLAFENSGIYGDEAETVIKGDRQMPPSNI